MVVKNDLKRIGWARWEIAIWHQHAGEASVFEANYQFIAKSSSCDYIISQCSKRIARADGIDHFRNLLPFLVIHWMPRRQKPEITVWHHD